MGIDDEWQAQEERGWCDPRKWICLHCVGGDAYAFRDEISKSVAQDGSEHIEYVPTQVVSEYFAQAFKRSTGKQVDGLIYPSAVVPGGKNLAMFPRNQNVVAKQSSQLFEVMALKTARSGRVLFGGNSVA